MAVDQHSFCEGEAGINPVAAHADIQITPIDPIHPEPFNELIGRRMIQGPCHLHRCLGIIDDAMGERAADLIDPHFIARLQLFRFLAQPRQQTIAQAGGGSQKGLKQVFNAQAGFCDFGARLGRLNLQAKGAIGIL